MDYLSRAETKRLFIEKGSSWIAQQQFWLFGTATYYNGETISRAEAESDAKHFFNILDRKIISRKDYNENRRLKRLVFVETGRTRDNTHIHFYIKGRNLMDYKKIWRLSEDIWGDRIKKGRDLEIRDNIDGNYERKGYTFKESDKEQYAHTQIKNWRKQQKEEREILASDVMTADVLLVDCCYI